MYNWFLKKVIYRYPVYDDDPLALADFAIIDLEVDWLENSMSNGSWKYLPVKTLIYSAHGLTVYGSKFQLHFKRKKDAEMFIKMWRRSK